MPTATKSLEEIKAELEEVRAKKEAAKAPPGKKDWYGLVYCDSNGYASIIGKNCQGIWLGRTDEIIPYLRKRHITGERVDTVLGAVEDFRAEKQAEILQGDFEGPRVSKSHSGHSATKKQQPYITDQGNNSVVATFRHDPQFLSLLKSLVVRDIGVRVIHSELLAKGYDIPQRTVTRWVAKIRSDQML